MIAAADPSTLSPAGATARSLRLPGYAFFAGLLAAAGLPIYIHAPKFYVDEYGVSLVALGGTLFALRFVDFAQDPLLGWLSERLRQKRQIAVAFGLALLAASMLALFAVTPPFAPLLWFALSLTGLFSAFSFLSITFYAQGVSKAGSLGEMGHIRVASWRETGALLGVCLAAVVPTLLLASGSPFKFFALGFALLCVVAFLMMRGEWVAGQTSKASGFRFVLSDRLARNLLILALVNAIPVAVSSTLFLFFVESRLGAAGWEGPLLLLFFLAAALSAPVWGGFAARVGAKKALLCGMVLSIAAFGFAALLETGDVLPFAVICTASGAALGADLTLLPAMFARRMAVISPEAGQAFGLWALVSKFSLAIAAFALLPVLEFNGFQSGADNPPEALRTLTLLYALVPCALKLVAIALLAATPIKEDD